MAPSDLGGSCLRGLKTGRLALIGDTTCSLASFLSIDEDFRAAQLAARAAVCAPIDLRGGGAFNSASRLCPSRCFALGSRPRARTISRALSVRVLVAARAS